MRDYKCHILHGFPAASVKLEKGETLYHGDLLIKHHLHITCVDVRENETFIVFLED